MLYEPVFLKKNSFSSTRYSSVRQNHKSLIIKLKQTLNTLRTCLKTSARVEKLGFLDQNEARKWEFNELNDCFCNEIMIKKTASQT